MTQTFKSQKELMQYLVDGGQIRARGWEDPRSYVKINESGKIDDENGNEFSMILREPEIWEKYTPPKKRKKVTIIEYIGDNGHISEWAFGAAKAWYALKPTGNTRDIEVDDE